MLVRAFVFAYSSIPRLGWVGRLGPLQESIPQGEGRDCDLGGYEKNKSPRKLVLKKTHITVAHPQRLLPQYQSVYEWLGNDTASSWLPHRFISHGLFGL